MRNPTALASEGPSPRLDPARLYTATEVQALLDHQATAISKVAARAAVLSVTGDPAPVRHLSVVPK